jgi:hypothetical protein
VADHHDTQAPVTHALDQIKDFSRLRDAECSGRLVEQNNLGIEQQGSGDRHRLALAAGKRSDRFAHTGDTGRKLAQPYPGLDLHRHLVEGKRAELPWPR